MRIVRRPRRGAHGRVAVQRPAGVAVVRAIASGIAAANAVHQIFELAGHRAVALGRDVLPVDRGIDRPVRPIERIDFVMAEDAMEPAAQIDVNPFHVALIGGQMLGGIVPDGDRFLLQRELVDARFHGQPRGPAPGARPTRRRFRASPNRRPAKARTKAAAIIVTIDSAIVTEKSRRRPEPGTGCVWNAGNIARRTSDTILIIR